MPPIMSILSTVGFSHEADTVSSIVPDCGADCADYSDSLHSAPADADIVDEIRKWQAVVTGVGD